MTKKKIVDVKHVTFTINFTCGECGYRNNETKSNIELGVEYGYYDSADAKIDDMVTCTACKAINIIEGRYFT